MNFWRGGAWPEKRLGPDRDRIYLAFLDSDRDPRVQEFSSFSIAIPTDSQGIKHDNLRRRYALY